MNPTKYMLVIAGPDGAGKSLLVNHYKLNLHLPITKTDAIGQAEPDTEAGKHLAQNASFGIETTLASDGDLALMRQARENGYRVCLVYIGTNSPEINVFRIIERERQSGAAVHATEIARRYFKSMQNLPKAMELAQRVIVLDWTGKNMEFVLSREGWKFRFVSRSIPRWARLHLREVIQQAKKEREGRSRGGR